SHLPRPGRSRPRVAGLPLPQPRHPAACRATARPAGSHPLRLGPQHPPESAWQRHRRAHQRARAAQTPPPRARRRTTARPPSRPRRKPDAAPPSRPATATRLPRSVTHRQRHAGQPPSQTRPPRHHLGDVQFVIFAPRITPVASMVTCVTGHHLGQRLVEGVVLAYLLTTPSNSLARCPNRHRDDLLAHIDCSHPLVNNLHHELPSERPIGASLAEPA